MSTLFQRKSILKDPALAAMGLLPVRHMSVDGIATDSPSAKSWRMAWISLAIGLVIVGMLFWSTAAQMARIWTDSDTFNHGFLIFPICGYLIWLKREALANLTPEPSWWGAGVIAVAGFGWLLGYVGSVAIVQHFTLVLLVQGLFLAIFGMAAARLLVFPLAYMFFAVPFGLFLIPPLQDLTAEFVVKGLRMIDIPVFLDGIFISIPTGNFEVAEACSGVRFLIATMALGTLFAHLTYQSRLRQAGFVALSFVVPIIANGFRAFGIVLVAYLSNNEIAVGVDHIVYGWVFFAIITVILLLIGMTFRDDDPEIVTVDSDAVRAARGQTGSRNQIGIVGAVAILLIAVSPAYASYLESRPLPVPPRALPVPGVGNGWTIGQANASSWKPIFPAAHARLRQSYRKGETQVDLFIAYYASQRQDAELISNSNQLSDEVVLSRAASGTRNVMVEGSAIPVYWARMLGRGQRNRVAYRWYWVAGQLTSNKYYAKILQAVDKLVSGKDTSAAIIISTPYDENWKDAEKSLQDFLGSVKPITSLLQDVSRNR
ncbi:MAG: exosortase A [Rhodospirillaceae bacterium]|nr:exosortase A [Rhodospirillaceae bacterium]MBT5455860.1 exosortase A [Rhodospirillaceae bacterium]